MQYKLHRKFTLIELLIVVVIISILAGLLMLAGKTIRMKGYSAATRNFIGQLQNSVIKYQTDLGVLPEPGGYQRHDFSSLLKYGDSSEEYCLRSPSNRVPVVFPTVSSNATYMESMDFSNGLTASDAALNNTDLLLPLFFKDTSSSDIEDDIVIAHSSRFLNFWLSCYGFGTGPYAQIESKRIANKSDNITFRKTSRPNLEISPWLYAQTNTFTADTFNFSTSGGAPKSDYQRSSADSGMKSTDYIPPTFSFSNVKYKAKKENDPSKGYDASYSWSRLNGFIHKDSGNLVSDTERRLYYFPDQRDNLVEDISTTNRSDTDPLEKTLFSDKVIYFGKFLGSANTVDSNKHNATTQSMLMMQASYDNVRIIKDHFETPLVYITYLNQKRDSAKTYKDVSLDKSLRKNAFAIYSLGPNKLDDSTIGEDIFGFGDNGTKDDIMVFTGSTRVEKN